MTKRQRVSTVLGGGAPDRPPLFDLLRNDAVLAYYSGLDPFSDPENAVYAAVRNILDSTRSLRLPDPEGEVIDQSGSKIVRRRWTSWRAKDGTLSVDEARADLKQRIEGLERQIDDEEAIGSAASEMRQSVSKQLERLGGDFAFVAPGFGVGIMVYTAYGLETFSYLLADDEDLVLRYLDLSTEISARRIARVEISDLAVGVFVGEDVG